MYYKLFSKLLCFEKVLANFHFNSPSKARDLRWVTKFDKKEEENNNKWQQNAFDSPSIMPRTLHNFIIYFLIILYSPDERRCGAVCVAFVNIWHQTHTKKKKTTD